MNKEIEIIKFLKMNGKASTSKIGNVLGINYWTLLDILEKLVKDNKIKRVEESRGTYWELK